MLGILFVLQDSVVHYELCERRISIYRVCLQK